MSAGEPTAKSHVQPSLPTLDPGVTHLTIDSPTTHAIHALAVDYVLLSGGDARWIDPGTHAQTDPLVDLAPSSRILERVHVARGFTPFQHFELLRSLPDTCSEQTELVVVPNLDRYYRDDSLLAGEGRDMLLSGLAALARVSRQRNIPVLLTRAVADEFSAPIENAATHTVVCESTQFGPRFRTDERETLVYPTDGGQWLQTTISYWEQILAARRPLYEQAGTAPRAQEVSVHGAN